MDLPAAWSTRTCVEVKKGKNESTVSARIVSKAYEGALGSVKTIPSILLITVPMLNTLPKSVTARIAPCYPKCQLWRQS